jgi:tricorn protease
VESRGVDPDVEVVQRSQGWAAGQDVQLGEAVRLALADHPAKVPPALP